MKPKLCFHTNVVGYLKVLILGQASAIVIFPHGFRITLSHICQPGSRDNFPIPSLLPDKNFSSAKKELFDDTTSAVSS